MHASNRFNDPELRAFHQDFVALASEFEDHAVSDQALELKIADTHHLVSSLSDRVDTLPGKDQFFTLQLSLQQLHSSIAFLTDAHAKLADQIEKALRPQVESLTADRHKITGMVRMATWLFSGVGIMAAGAWWLWQRIETLVHTLAIH